MNTPLTKQQITKIKELRDDGFTCRQIAKLVQCGASSVLYHTNQHTRRLAGGENIRGRGKRLDEKLRNEMHSMFDSAVSNKYISRQTGISVSTIRKHRHPELAQQYKDRNAHRATRKRQIWVDLKNERHNKCELCGYDRHPKCLDFHHKNPKDKLFTISQSEGRNIDAVYAEAAKCILVCKNCHALIHAGVIEITLTY
jgi:hypothetical protein